MPVTGERLAGTFLCPAAGWQQHLLDSGRPVQHRLVGLTVPVAVSWNGKAWSIRQLPGAGTGNASMLESVNCLSAKRCTAIGETVPISGIKTIPFVGFWNGSAWKLMAV
jgi:hypothetical protein